MFDSYYFFMLNYMANLCQLLDFQMNISQVSNDEIMKDLQEQDEMLQNEIISKLDIIIKQNKEILKKLEL